MLKEYYYVKGNTPIYTKKFKIVYYNDDKH